MEYGALQDALEPQCWLCFATVVGWKKRRGFIKKPGEFFFYFFQVCAT